MSDIVISEFMSDDAVDTLRAHFAVTYAPDLVDDVDALTDRIKSARALIVRNRTQVNSTLLANASGLEVVGRLGVGLDNIDLDACRQRDITVCPATGANTDAVAEYVIMSTLMLLRGAWHRTLSVISGEWPRQQSMGREIAGLTLALVGCGSIAFAVAERARALGMRCTGYDPLVPEDAAVWRSIERKSSLGALLSDADCVSLHVPLTDSTRHLISATTLADLKHGAVLINTSRGGVVDESALIECLETGQLGGVALDVFETEPATAVSLKAFESTTNVLFTPHIAGVTEQSNVRVSMLTAQNVLRVLQANA